MEEEGVHIFIDGEEIALTAKNTAYADLYGKWLNDPICRKYMRFQVPKTLEEIKQFLVPQKGIKEMILLDIYHKAEKKVIGNIGLSSIHWFNRNGNLFYLVGEREYWGRGLASKAVYLLLNYGFKELNLHKIYAKVMGPNLASMRILDKFGFTLEGTLREEYYIDGKYYDLKHYGLLRTEWINRENK
jgi:RimJ/RimL family protein N-acetyltransferase